MQKNTVLIVDDEKFNIELAGVYLEEEGYKVLFALSGAKALELLHSQKVDLILLDINMPGLDGFTVCKKLKKDNNFADIPVIFLTALSDIESITKAFETGGVDYITKPFNPLELKARVKTQMRMLHLMEDLRQKQSKLAQLSISDPFTRLPNALYFESQLKVALKSKAVWVLFLSVDHLKKLNRLYGFAKTNKLLVRFSKLLRESCFANAKIARVYGGSFGVIFEDYSLEDIEKNVKAIQRSLREDDILKEVFRVDAVVYRAEKGITLERLYAKLQAGLENIEHAYSFNYAILN